MLFNYCKWQSIPIILVNKEKEVLETMPDNIDIGISYGFGLIFKKKTIVKIYKGIWNIHTGSLPNYRGRHPITCAFLKGDKKIGVTIHQIDKYIDKGVELASGYICRSMDDDLKNIEDKIISLLRESLIYKAINNYKNNNIQKIEDGDYHESFLNGISIDSVSDVDGHYLFNAIRAQRVFGGVNVEGKIYDDAYFYNEKFSNLLQEADIVECKDGVKLALFDKRLNI
jgi:methionyl-tRNA formyltransferase